jgi:hypothetical protein
MFNFNKKRTDDILKGLREPTWKVPMNQEPTRECCEKCRAYARTNEDLTSYVVPTCIDKQCPFCHSIKPPVEELSPELSWGDELVEKSFLSNILDGIDIADKQMGNKGGGTKAIRFALQSRIGIDLAKEREQAFNSGRASMVVEVREWMEKNIANIEKLSDKNSMKECTLLVFNELLQALKNKENE